MNQVQATSVTAASPGVQASVIVCTYRRDRVLVETIEQLLKLCHGAAEIIVVDQKAQHDAATSEYLRDRSRDGDIRYFNLPQAGLTLARNFGAAQARGEILLYCDDDVILSADWVRAHLAAYRDPKVSAVAGQVLHPGEKAQDAPGSFAHNAPLDSVAAIYGANFSIRKGVYEDIGGSDENLGVHAYTEDLILAERLLNACHRIAYSPDAAVLHLMAPQGGCRITDASQETNEWEKPYSKLYWLHLNPPRTLRQWLGRLWGAARNGPLRKDTVVRFWRQPAAWAGFFQSYFRARKAARSRQRLAASQSNTSTTPACQDNHGQTSDPPRR